MNKIKAQFSLLIVPVYPMKIRSSVNTNHLSSLTVSHKSLQDTTLFLHNLPDAVIQTDLEFNIKGWNGAAEKLYGLPGAMGKNLFKLINTNLIDSSLKAIQRDLLAIGSWEGEVIYHRHDGEKYYFRTNANFILNESAQPVAIIFVNHNITKEKDTEVKLAEAETTYQKLVNTLVDGVVMINAEGKISACNKRAAEILGFTEEELIGKVTASPSWNAIKPDGSKFPLSEFPAIVSLQTGFPQRNVKMGIKQPDGIMVWLTINSEALIHPGEFEPYAVVVSFSDITEHVNREEELRKSNERFYYVSKITSDAIWDLDLLTNEIYRSDAFCDLSGYSRQDIKPDLDWWFNKVHTQDRERVRKKINEYIQKGYERWEDEYLFMCANGNYKFILDTGIILYRNGQPVRILGAIRDLTEKRRLENQFLIEKEQKHKAINHASITAQETERSDISKELHDNVNQILMSAKLFIESAKKDPLHSSEFLDKALEYQMMAVEEIRKLSRSLNSSFVKVIGLRHSIDEIVLNMSSLQNIEVKFIYDEKLEKKLSDVQKLMIFRIVQEQTSNIIKYSQARKVTISIKENKNIIYLDIMDNGRGFNPDAQPRGIGFINIFNRVDAFDGTVEIKSSPGHGCTLEVSFPLEMD